MIGSKPSSKMFRPFLQKRKHDSIGSAQPGIVPPSVSPLMNTFPVEVVLEWLDATRSLKQLRLAPANRDAWVKIIGRSMYLTPAQLAMSRENINYEQLRRGRIRLDSVAMLLYRSFFVGVVMQSVYNIYMFTDGSPQWRGLELFATSFDLITTGTGWTCSRRLMPVIRLGLYMATAKGKTFAMLWKVVLLVGPSFYRLREFLRRVRAITSDMGTERLLAGQPDMLLTFCECLGIPIPFGSLPQLWLFPRALQAPDWMHIFDTLIKRGLASARWFPHFLEVLKSLLKMLRNHRADIRHDLDAIGFHAVSDLLTSVSMPYFANWRWKTLHLACKAIGSHLDTLTASFSSFKFLAKLRDTVMAKHVHEALACQEWRAQFFFVSWFGRWLTHLQSWGGSCVCHAECFLRGEAVECHKKGRLLRVAHDHAIDGFIAGMEDIEGWTVAMFNGDDKFMADILGIVRMVVALGEEKLAFMMKIPYVHGLDCSIACLNMFEIRNTCSTHRGAYANTQRRI
jgi:hypothetical protein